MQITQLLRKESQKVHVTNKGGKGDADYTKRNKQRN